MLTKKITYMNYNDEEETRECYFNLSKYELEVFDARYPGGFVAYAESIIAAKDGDKLFQLLEDLIMKCYGVRTPEGLFVKNEKARETFRYCGAFDEMMYEMLQNPQLIEPFLQGVLPKTKNVQIDSYKSTIPAPANG